MCIFFLEDLAGAGHGRSPGIGAVVSPKRSSGASCGWTRVAVAPFAASSADELRAAHQVVCQVTVVGCRDDHPRHCLSRRDGTSREKGV